MKIYKKGSVSTIVLAILILGILAFGGYKILYKASPVLENQNVPVDSSPSDYKTVDHTNVSKTSFDSDWQIFRNQASGFEFKYPKNFSAKTVRAASDFDFMFVLQDDKETFTPIWFYFADNKEKPPVLKTSEPSQYVEIKKGVLSVKGIQWDTVEEINIPVQGVGTTASSFRASTQKGKSTYLFECLNCNTEIFGKDGENNRLMFDQILSTFKFTNSSSAYTSNWKTYRNEKYGFELTMTDSWKNFITKENPNGDIEFYASAESFRLYYVGVVSIQEWDKEKEACKQKSQDEQDGIPCYPYFSWEIGRNDKYVFVAHPPQDFPSEDQYLVDDFQSKILTTFKFTK
jgi:hypothetical protein